MKTKISWGVGLLAAVSIAVALEIVLLAPYPITFENYADDAAFDADLFFEQTSVGNDPSSIDLATGCGVQGTKCIQFSAQGNAGPRLEHKEEGLTLEAGKTYFVAYGAKGTGSVMVILDSEGNFGKAKIKDTAITPQFQDIIVTFTPINTLTTSKYKLEARQGVLDTDDLCQGEFTDLGGPQIFGENFEGFVDDAQFDADPSFVQTTLGEEELNPFAGSIDLVEDTSKAVTITTNPGFTNRLTIVKDIPVIGGNYYQLTFSAKGNAAFEAEVADDNGQQTGLVKFKGTELDPGVAKTATVGYAPLTSGNINLQITANEGTLTFDTIAVSDHGNVVGKVGNTGCDGGA